MGRSKRAINTFALEPLVAQLARAPRLDTAAFAAALRFVALAVDLDSRDVRDVFAFAKAMCEREGVRRLCAAGLLHTLCGDASRQTRAAALTLLRRCAHDGLVSVEVFEGAFDARRASGHISMEQAQVDLRSALTLRALRSMRRPCCSTLHAWRQPCQRRSS